MIKQYINKRDNKKYYMFQIYLGKDEITRKDKYTTRRGFRTKKEAEIAYSKLKLEASEILNTVNKDITTFKELFELWYDGYKFTVKESTLIVSNSIFKIILSKFEYMQLKKISVAYCQKVLNEWSKKYEIYKKIKSYVVNMFNYAIELKIMTINPMAIAKTPKKPPKICDNKDLYYTKDELKHFFSLIQDSEDLQTIVMFRLLAFTGCRKCELLALKWEDIDFDNKIVNINKTMAHNTKYETIIQTPKCKASIRKISIDDTTALMLNKWRLQQRVSLFKIGYNANNKNQLCFSNPITNTYLNKRHLNYRLDTICKKHNFKRIKIHGFRHTHCSLLFESGASIQEVQERLGHSDIKVTMNIYAHVTEKQKEYVGQKFAKYVNF